MPNWEEIRREWENNKITFKALAEKHGVKDSTVRSRKNREKWQRNGSDATQRNESVATKKSGADEGKKKKATSKGQKKRGGNPNPVRKFTKRNSAALKHGLFSKYIPEETMELMGMIEQTDPIELLWSQIQIQYAAIIRAQKIMWVDTDDDHLNEVASRSASEFGDSTSYKVVYAHERYQSFLSAQSRAMSELRSLIKQYDELIKSDLATEEQKARIDLLKSKVPNQDTSNINEQITSLAELINNPEQDRVIDDE